LTIITERCTNVKKISKNVEVLREIGVFYRFFRKGRESLLRPQRVDRGKLSAEFKSGKKGTGAGTALIIKKKK